MFSGPKETRTPDFFNAIEALYQLSYRPVNGELIYITFYKKSATAPI